MSKKRSRVHAKQTEPTSEIPDSINLPPDVDEAIKAAMEGRILEGHDSELDSDELVPLSDAEDDENDYSDEEANNALSDLIESSNHSLNSKEKDIEKDNEDLAEETDEVEELEEDPDEGDFDDFNSSDSESEVDSLFTKGSYSNGAPREIYPDIIPGYESDSSTDETTLKNTIGDIDIALYDSLPHLGYDINGKRIMRPAVGPALDALLDTFEGKQGYTGIKSRETGLDVKLSESELDIIKRIRRAELPDAEYNQYEDYVPYFSGQDIQISGLSNAPEPKSRFVPSKHEQKRVMRIVRAIRSGAIVPSKPKLSKEEQIEQRFGYDIWENEVAREDHIMNIPAPKMTLPSHAESYNPPAEYLPTEEERQAWLAQDPEDRDRDFLPQKYSSLRLVPGYSEAVKERFERCLDLYLAPRIRRNKLNIDPESLIPKLPSPQDLRPFPTKLTHTMLSHKGRVRCLSASPCGNYLASGGDDGTVKFWEILTGRCLHTVAISGSVENDAVTGVKWNPNSEIAIVLVTCGEKVYLVLPLGLFDEEIEGRSREIASAGYSYVAQNATGAVANSDGKKKPSSADWLKPSSTQETSGILLVINIKRAAKQLDWHRRGDYFSTTSPDSSSSSSTNAVLIHQLSKHSSQSPFAKSSKGAIQAVLFHPVKAVLFVASQRYIRVYNLQKQELVRTLQSGLRWISSMSIHPSGDNIIVGSYDKKLAWFDLDLSPRPYRTLKYHTAAIRSVNFHPSYPLFASSSDDGTIQVFHGMVYNDYSKNALIVPLKVLKGHEVKSSLGVLQVEWHHRKAWCFSGGADGTVRMWT